MSQQSSVFSQRRQARAQLQHGRTAQRGIGVHHQVAHRFFQLVAPVGGQALQRRHP
ncbi:MAG: hypothetical protein M3P85_06075 [Actinomycetota bacterium]|nr:hypothetical protein [Actinomycetota bacterium]